MAQLVAVCLAVVLTCCLPGSSHGLGEIFCGRENCYNLLRVDQNATARQIQKAFRNVSLVLHPDKNPSPTAADEFRRIANAYEILNDNGTRSDYDYALAHPREHMLNYYRFHRNRMYRQMKVPPQYTIAGMILLCSVIHYYTKYQMYESAMRGIRQSAKYRARLKELLEEQDAAVRPLGKARKQGSRARKLSELGSEEMGELERTVDAECVLQGGRKRPVPADILAWQLLLLPLRLAELVRWQAQWAWDYGVQRKPYDEAAQEYLTRQAMRLTPEAWEAMDEQQRAEAVARKLWIPENQKAWVDEQVKLEELKYKRYYSRRR